MPPPPAGYPINVPVGAGNVDVDINAPGVVDRLQDFVTAHKRAVLLGAAAVVASAGVAYYVASSSRPGSGSGSRSLSGGDLEKSAADKKKSSKGKKRKSTKDADGPLLEEISAPTSKAGSDDEGEDVVLAETDILTMSTEARAKAAASLKAKGNTAYQARSFETAAEFYTRAIAVSPKAEPVFYSNRAACYVNMSPPQHDLVVRDCDIALQLDKTYIKALNRRAAAHEGLNQLQEALRDYTAATILDKFQNESTAQAVERVLKKLAQQTAEDMLKAREPRLPSYTFVSAYFAAFRARPKPTLPSEEEGQLQGDNTLMMGLDALAAADYVHAFTLINESLDQGVSTDKLRAVALNQRGTFKFLVGDVAGAKADLEASLALDRSLTQTWVKIASVHMERGDPQAAFAAFNEAIMQDENDADIYYHRGQVLFIMNEFAEAAENYTKSTELDGNFVFSQIQLAVAQYKGEMLGKAMATFRATLRNFPNRSEPQNYYGELLLDQGRFEEAVEKFEKAVELEKANPRQNVLPMVNKGLALFQWKQDIGAAESSCREALAIDDECEAAVATLAQLALQQGRVEEAVGLFERQAELARSEPELVNALTYKFASGAQLNFAKEYPAMASQMSAMARQMM